MFEEDYTQALEMATIGLEMAKSLIGLKDFEASKSLIDEMINDQILDSYTREKANCYHLQGRWYSEQKLYKKAFESFSYAKILAESYEDVYLLKDIQQERCSLCELMGDINSGYKVQKEYIALVKEISKKELESLALKLQIKYSIASIEKEANTDYLTGIYNRNYLESTVNKLLKQANKKNESIICMVFDLDDFKSINDEFVIILKGIQLKNGEKKAEQILETIRNLNIQKDGKRIPITISIGVTDNLSCAAMYFNEIFNIADLRLYKAKNGGRNQVCAVN